MAIDNIESNAPENMQPYIRALENKIRQLEAALLTAGIKV